MGNIKLQEQRLKRTCSSRQTINTSTHPKNTYQLLKRYLSCQIPVLPWVFVYNIETRGKVEFDSKHRRRNSYDLSITRATKFIYSQPIIMTIK
jgi:hypothetical protein